MGSVIFYVIVRQCQTEKITTWYHLHYISTSLAKQYVPEHSLKF